MRRRIDPRHSAPPPTVRPPPLAVLVLAYWFGGWPVALAGAAGFLLGIYFDDLIGAWR